MEAEYNHLNHATWDCKYHVVFSRSTARNCCSGRSSGTWARYFTIWRDGSRIEEGHLMPDHVHMLISIPPKYSVAQIVGYMKGKSSIWRRRQPKLVQSCR